MSSVTAKIMLELYFGKDWDVPKFTIDDVFALFKKEEHKCVKRVIGDLKRNEFIKQKQNYDGSVVISLSEKGKLRALNIIFREFAKKKEMWDGKWRMISFDIPDFCARGRKALVYRLKTGGFYKLQESLFLYPYDCDEEIKALAVLFKIEKYIRFGLLEKIDIQSELVHHFKLVV